MSKSFYISYLKSPYWIERRRLFLEKKENQECCVCGSKNNLNVHHLRYRGQKDSLLYHERDLHLATLCKECHSIWHEVASKYDLDKRSRRKWLNKWKKNIAKYGKKRSLQKICKAKRRQLDKLDFQDALKKNHGVFWKTVWNDRKDQWVSGYSELGNRFPISAR